MQAIELGHNIILMTNKVNRKSLVPLMANCYLLRGFFLHFFFFKRITFSENIQTIQSIIKNYNCN